MQKVGRHGGRKAAGGRGVACHGKASGAGKAGRPNVKWKAHNVPKTHYEERQQKRVVAKKSKKEATTNQT